MIKSTDRVDLVPRHTGNNVLPNSPLFTQLLRHARRQARLAIRDVHLDLERTYGQLLGDALRLRQGIRKCLPRSVLEDLEAGLEVFIGVLAPGGYEYAVAILAVLALGAAIVPMSVVIPVEEASDFVTRSNQVALVSSAASLELANSISKHVSPQTLPVVIAAADSAGEDIPISSMVMSSDFYPDDNAAGAVIFTSGTTGKPKAAVLRRGYMHDAARWVADHFELTPQDVSLHVLPVHHVSGLAINFLPFLIAGACVEFRSGSFDVAWTWNRWKQGGLTIFSGVPTIYMRMMRYFEHKLAKLPQAEISEYIAGARQFRALLCGTSALPRPLQEFWTKLRRGRAILTRYGSTEVGVALAVDLNDRNVPDGSVGKVALGSELKLSDGDEGEILVKTPYLFSKYLSDTQATADAHNVEGYFRTGDIARREGEYYFIVGRASQDIIKSGGYKISALDIEREALALPYISEVMVVGVEDEEFGQRVAAAISFREDQETYSAHGDPGKRLSIDTFRRDLSDRLARYKLPTLLRIVEGELPKTASGKVMKKVLGPQLFPAPACVYEAIPDVQVWRSHARL